MINNSEIYAQLEAESEDKYSNLGNLLHNRRLDMNISLEKMATSLRLSSRFIQMIEEGNYNDVAQKIYYLGYIRNMSRYLKLEEEILLNYLSEKKNVVSDESNQFDKFNILTHSMLSANKNKVKYKNYTIYLLILVFIGSFLIIGKQLSTKKNDSFLVVRKQNIKLQ